MPAVRPESSKSRKPKASSLHPTSKSPSPKSSSSRPDGAKGVACHAWWCNSTFTRRADMMKHVESEHFGKRFRCIICDKVMKQGSNMSTHLNKHTANFCTLCSCGQGFTDPSACTRHRNATGHAEGITHRKDRPIFVPPVKVQHLTGSVLTVQMISDPTFIPPSFDESYHLRGKPKPKAQEKYNPVDYLTTGEPGFPPVASAQAPGNLSPDVAPVTQYQEPPPSESPAPVQTEIRVDGVDLNVHFSYDLELPQEPRRNQTSAANEYTVRQAPPPMYPIYQSQTPSDGYYTPPEAVSPYNSYSTTTPNVAANPGLYPQQYPANYPMTINYRIPLPPQPFVEPHARKEYPEALHGWNPPGPTPPLSFDLPYPNVSGVMTFTVRAPEDFQQPQYQQQFQPLYQPNNSFNNHVYQPALAAY